mgnify:CR=1 FL=1
MAARSFLTLTLWTPIPRPFKAPITYDSPLYGVNLSTSLISVPKFFSVMSVNVFITLSSILHLESVLSLIWRHFAIVFQFIPVSRSCSICCLVMCYYSLPPILKILLDHSPSVPVFKKTKAIEICLKTSFSSDIKFSERFSISIEAFADVNTCR